MTVKKMEETRQDIEHWYRTKQVLERIPVSKSTWWAGVKSGRYPKPTYFGDKIPCWSDSDLKSLGRKEG